MLHPLSHRSSPLLVRERQSRVCNRKPSGVLYFHADGDSLSAAVCARLPGPDSWGNFPLCSPLWLTQKYYKHSYGCIGLFYGPGDPDSGCMAGATCSLPSSHLPRPATKGICLGKVLFGSVPNNWTHCGGVVKLQIDTMYWESCGYPL